MKRLTLIVLTVLAGCSSKPQPQEVVIKFEESWRAGLTDAQAAEIKATERAAHRKLDALLTELEAMPTEDATAKAAAVSLKLKHDEFQRMLVTDGLPKAASWYFSQLKDASVKSLAMDQQKARNQPR